MVIPFAGARFHDARCRATSSADNARQGEAHTALKQHRSRRLAAHDQVLLAAGLYGSLAAAAVAPACSPIGNPLVLSRQVLAGPCRQHRESRTPRTAVAGRRPIMLTLTAISGAAVVSTLRQRPCQRPLRKTRRLGAADRAAAGARPGCCADVRFDRGSGHRRERWRHPPQDPPSPCGNMCSS
jgi:hypothetical protein